MYGVLKLNIHFITRKKQNAFKTISYTYIVYKLCIFITLLKKNETLISRLAYYLVYSLR